MRSSLGPWAALVLMMGCASSTTTTTTQPTPPAPEPGAPPPNAPPPSGLVYLPVRDARYALERHDSLTLQLPGGGSQVQFIDRKAYLHISLVPDTASYRVTIVLDSLQATVGGVPAAPDSVLPARGTQWTATLTPGGALSTLKADRSTTLGDQIGSNLRTLFPALPANGVRAGMEWTDTTVVPIRADAFDAVERSFTSYRASESDDPAGNKAIKVESSGRYQRTGKGTQYDQQLEMTASGTRTAVHYLNPDGTLALARGSDSGDMTITVPAVGQTVPVKQSGNYTITAIRPAKR